MKQNKRRAPITPERVPGADASRHSLPILTSDEPAKVVGGRGEDIQAP